MKTTNVGTHTRLVNGTARLTLAVFPLLWCLTAVSTIAADVSPGALEQISALLAEKATWTPVQAKMDSELVHAVKNLRGQPFAPSVTNLQMEVKVQTDGRVLVDISAEVSSNLLALIKQGGGEVINSFSQFQAIRASVALDQIETLAGSADVKFIRRAVRALTNTGSVDSQGDVTHLAGAARTGFGATGAGIKVGVLSDSVDYLANSQALGDLGTVTVLAGQSGVPGSGEGTAMLEIVHDLAPNAQLYFATAFTGEAGFAQNILNLYSNGCKIILDDVGYFDESPFQDGVVARAVNTVTAGGALYFSSAANSGNLDAGTSGTWEGDFVDGGAASSPIPEAGRLHSFGAFAYNTVTAAGFAVDLFWSDPLGASTNDYDVFLLDSTGSTVVSSSMNRQNGTQDPYEYIGGMSTGQRIVIVKYSGAARFLHLDTQRGRLSIPTTGATVGHSAATNAFSVAATPAPAAFPNAFTSGNLLETFSSDGPRHVFYQADGTAITPGNFLSPGGAIRQKPDITAADGVVTTLPSSSGLNPFYGTSAAAPHAGAIAALIWSYNPALTPTQIRSLLTGSALDIGAVGVDRDSGYGIVMAYNALTNLTGIAPPGINLQPANQSVLVGGTATFGVTAVGTPPFSYAWRRNGTPIVGASSSTYTTNNVQVADSGAQFSCLVSNVQGTLISSNGILTVLVPLANDQCSGATVISSASFTTNESTVTATSTGDPAPSCVGGFGSGVWFQYTAPSGGQLVVDTVGSDFDTGLGVYTGACGSLVQIGCNDDSGGTLQSSVTNSVTAGTTYHILAGGYAAATGNLVFHLTFTSVSGAPVITQQPLNQTVAVGGTAIFTIIATGTTPLSYFWKRNGAYITGATNSTYSTNNVQLADTGTPFSCLVSNAFGTTNSSSAILTVVPALGGLITFDDLSGASGPIPVGYHGMTWSNFYYLDAADYGTPSGYGAGMISASNVAFNGFGTSAYMSNASAFNLSSAFLTAAWSDNLQVQAIGSNGGTLLYSNVYVLSATNPILINFNYNGVTRVDFISSGGTQHTNYTSSGTHFAMDNVSITAAAAGLRVAIFGAPAVDAWNNDVSNKIAGSSLFTQVDAFLVSSNRAVPTLAQLQQYSAVLVYSDLSFNNSVALGNVLADYLDAGGGVVMNTFAFWASGGLAVQGRLATGGYLPFTTALQTNSANLTLVGDQPAHPILSGVNSFNGGTAGYHNWPIGISSNATLVAHWTDNQPLVATKQLTGGRMAGLNFYPPSSDARSDFWTAGTDGAKLMANALLWAAGGGGTTVVTTTNVWNGTDFIYSFGEPNTATYGQTFIAPSASLNNFTLYMNNTTNGVDFRFYVMAWDGTKATGPILYQSAPTTTTGQTGWHAYTFNLGSVPLIQGASYVAFVSASTLFDGITGLANVGATYTDSYTNGYFVFNNNGSDFTLLTNSTWSSFGGYDLAFVATFGGGSGGAAPSITTQPANQTVVVGGTATFNIGVAGSAPLSYHWKRNGTTITGATNSTYGINNVQLSDSGSLFSCQVSNVIGVANSSSAQLTVVPGPVFLTGSYLYLPIQSNGVFIAANTGGRYNPVGTGGAAGVDFWFPGTPVYNYVVGVGGVNYPDGNFTSLAVTNLSGAGTQRALIRGIVIPGLSFTRDISFAESSKVIRILDTLQNTGASTLSSVVTLDNTDPDQDSALSTNATYETLNDVVSINLVNDLVVASGPITGLSLGLGSDSGFQIPSATGFSNVDAYAYLTVVDPNGASDDIALNLAQNYGTLVPGQTKSVVWYMVFGNSKAEVTNTFAALANPPWQLTGMNWSNCIFRCILHGPVGSNFVVQVSSNLVNWTTLSTYTIPPGGSVPVLDPGACIRPMRFYRAALATSPATGTVIAWGLDGDGQTNVPPNLTNALAVAGGVYHSLALKPNGTVIGWGANDLGETNPPAGLNNVVAVAAGWGTSLALKSDGTLEEWGWDGSNHGLNLIATAHSMTNITAIAACWDCLMALRGDGTVSVWGYSTHGETNIPPGLSGVIAIAGGGYHCLALKNDGTVVAWGNNGAGQAHVPAGLTGVTKIAAGGSHSLALKFDGTVAAWGDNSYGQINVPPALGNVIGISGGYNHSLALKADGTVIGWGDNSYGQTSVPPGLTNVFTISAGGNHNLVITNP